MAFFPSKNHVLPNSKFLYSPIKSSLDEPINKYCPFTAMHPMEAPTPSSLSGLNKIFSSLFEFLSISLFHI